MKKLVILCGLLIGLSAFTQTATVGELVVKHHHYKTYYNPATREPDSVAWDLTPDMVNCKAQVRKDAFRKDPLLPNSASPKDYQNSGYDKGHLFSYDDAQCDNIDKIECFYMTNMLPQIHPFNAGDWKVLEMQERAWASKTKLHIIAGGIGSIGQLKYGENIPKYMYKAIYMDGKYKAWIMPNSKSSAGHKYDYWMVDVKKLDQQTGLKL